MTDGDVLTEAVSAVAGACAILSPSSFEWFGRLVVASPDGSDLTEALASCIYRQYYVFGRPKTFASIGATIRSQVGETPLVARFDRLTAGEWYVERGWTVLRVEGEMATVEREGLLVRSPRDRIVTLEDGTTGLRRRAGSTARAPGFYSFVQGVHGVPDSRADRVHARVYWHSSPASVELLVSAMLTVLRRDGVASSLKALRDDVEYRRCDSVVLYLERSQLVEFARRLRETLASLRGLLRAGSPALTFPVAEGVAIADDPGDGRSYGELVSTAIAETFVDAWRSGRTDPSRLRDTLAERLHASGRVAVDPWLSAGASGRDFVAFGEALHA